MLGVPEELLAQYTAVSGPVARAMAEGVRALTGSDLAVSVTGVAGPGRDDDGHPGGAGLRRPDRRRAYLGAPSGARTGRGRIRVMAAHHAFDLLRRYLTQLPITEETEGE